MAINKNAARAGGGAMVIQFPKSTNHKAKITGSKPSDQQIKTPYRVFRKSRKSIEIGIYHLAMMRSLIEAAP